MNVLLDVEGSARLPKVVVILYLVSSNNTKILHIQLIGVYNSCYYPAIKSLKD